MGAGCIVSGPCSVVTRGKLSFCCKMLLVCFGFAIKAIFFYFHIIFCLSVSDNRLHVTDSYLIGTGCELTGGWGVEFPAKFSTLSAFYIFSPAGVD